MRRSRFFCNYSCVDFHVSYSQHVPKVIEIWPSMKTTVLMILFRETHWERSKSQVFMLGFWPFHSDSTWLQTIILLPRATKSFRSLEYNMYQHQLIDYSNYNSLSCDEIVSGHLKTRDHLSHWTQDNMFWLFKTKTNWFTWSLEQILGMLNNSTDMLFLELKLNWFT